MQTCCPNSYLQNPNTEKWTVRAQQFTMPIYIYIYTNKFFLSSINLDLNRFPLKAIIGSMVCMAGCMMVVICLNQGMTQAMRMLEHIFEYKQPDLVTYVTQLTRYTLIAYLTIVLGIVLVCIDALMTSAYARNNPFCRALESQLSSVLVG